MKFTLEVIGFNIESCLLAQSGGAHRIELCDNPGEGGTTPSYGFIKAARNNLHIDLFPIIRPRGGDFLYSNAEFEIMKADIKICKELECNGVVFGLLNADGSIDKKKCSKLVELAYPMAVSFHRAFDRVSDSTTALEEIIECGFERILTSGLQPTAIEGAKTIAALMKQADERIVIMPGSGIRSANIIELAKKTGASEFHSSARTNTESSMIYRNKAMNENLISVSVDEDEVKNLVKLLSQA